MTILVTGGAGYIGSVCVEHLCDAGHEVVVIDDLSEGHRDAVDGRASFVEANLHDRVTLVQTMRTHSVTAVIHFAAFALVGESMVDPGKYFENNVAGGLSLLQAMKEAEVRRIVFSSTCATYGIPENETSLISEETAQIPVNPYGESKLAFEKILHWFQKIHSVEPVMFRYFNAAGASERFGEDHAVETHLIPNVLKVALGQKECAQIYGTDYPTPDGTAVRDFIHVKDLAEIHRQAVEGEQTGAFNLGTGAGASVREVVAVCEKVVGKEIASENHPRREGDPPLLAASNEKVSKAFGWTPEFSLEDAVRDAWDWHQRFPLGYSSCEATSGQD